MNCSAFPFGRSLHPGYWAANAIFLPLLTSVGVVGNLLIIIILCHSYLRCQSPIYTYLMGLAVVDLLTLCLAGPEWLRDMGALDREVGFSRDMAYFSTMRYVADNILKHSALWLIAFVLMVQWVKLNQVYTKRRWMKISASRIIVFAIVLGCLVVDLPRVFERHVTRMLNHCFRLELWSWTLTDFAFGPIYRGVYPWATLVICYLLPSAMLVCFFITLCNHIRVLRLLKNLDIVRINRNHDDRQTTFVLLVLSMFFVIFEVCDSTAFALQDFDIELTRPDHTNFQTFAFAAHCLSLIHSSGTFILYIVFSHDFRKTLRRVFCCCCGIDDPYYEPVTCSALFTRSRQSSQSSEEDEYYASMQEVKKKPQKKDVEKKKGEKKKKKDKENDARPKYDGPMWI